MNIKEELLSLFKDLKLKAFTDNYEEVIEVTNNETKECLLALCKLERERKYNAKVKRKIRTATFPKVKTFSMLDYKKTPKLPKQTVKKLSTCKFINQKQNVILVGDSGGGKTHLAIALGINACQKGHSVKFYTACQLANKLLKEYKEGDIEKFMSKLKRFELLIIDELGYVPFSKKASELLFQVISDKYEAGSIIITSNLNFSQWTHVFIDQTLTAALLDRITHDASIIKYDWGSVRFNQALQKFKTQEDI